MLNSKRDIKRDRIITLLKEDTVVSATGGRKFSGYSMIENDPQPYARVLNKTGTEVVQNDQITHIQQSVFTVLYRTDLNLSIKIAHENKLYAILSFAESGETRKKYTDITAEFLQEYVIT